MREISKWLRAHPKSSGSKTPKKKSDDSVGTAAPQKNPAEKLAQLAVALTASAGEQSRNARYCVRAVFVLRNMTSVLIQVKEQPRSFRDGCRARQTSGLPDGNVSLSTVQCMSMLITFSKGLVGVEFNRRNGDTFGLHVCISVYNGIFTASYVCFFAQGKAASGFSVEEMFQVRYHCVFKSLLSLFVGVTTGTVLGQQF